MTMIIHKGLFPAGIVLVGSEAIKVVAFLKKISGCDY